MYKDNTYELIKERVLDKIGNSLDKREGSFVNDMVSPYCLELERVYQEFNYLLSIMFLENSNTEELEKRASEYGVTRKLGQKAKGAVTFTGTVGAIVPKGTLVSTTTGLLFETDHEIKLTEAEGTVNITAKEIGSMYNLEVGTITNLPMPVSSVVSISNKVKTIGGVNKETDKELLGRILDKIKNPSNGGNIADFRRWATEVNGVGDAKVFPLWNGNGTVKIVPITTEKKAPDSNIIANVKNNIEAKKPIFGQVTVEAPLETTVNISAKIKMDHNYSLDIIKEEYNKRIKKYIEDSVLKVYTVDYFKCLSFFYDIEGVTEVIEFKLNNGNSNLSIDTYNIQVLGSVAITV